MITTITRNLEDGPDYRPDFRHQLVFEILKAHAASGGKLTWEELLAHESDVVVRQAVRYHLGNSLITEAVRYALVAEQSNTSAGMASVIRAMVIADRTTAEIAAELKTKPLNILIFILLFFDVPRYLDREFWLEGLTWRFCQGTGSEQVKERRLLKIAFERGWEGLQEALSPRKNRSAEDVKLVMEQVQHVVATRALEFVQDLQEAGLPATEADFVRYMQVTAVKGREAPADKPAMDWGEWLREAADREIIPPHITEMAITGIDESDPSAGSRRRRKVLTEDSWSSQWMNNRKRLAAARVDNKPEVPAGDGPSELEQVEVAPNGSGESQPG